MAVRLEQLTKRYVAPDGSTVPVIDIDRFDLADGEQVALVGSSGSGKTTLLHLIAGILAPDGGRILFGDVDVAGLSEAQRDVFRGRNLGYIFQTHHLLPGFTALENVLLGMTFGGAKHDPAWARHLLGEVGLGDRLAYKPAKLSVGQQQRVAIARALANRPKLVLADEPTGALDTRTGEDVLALLKELNGQGRTILVVTHDLSVAKHCPREIYIRDGRIVEPDVG